MFRPETVMRQCAQLDEPSILNESTLVTNVSVSAVLCRPETGNAFKLEFGVNIQLFAKFLVSAIHYVSPETGNAVMLTSRCIKKYESTHISLQTFCQHHSVFVAQKPVMRKCAQFVQLRNRSKSTLVSKVSCQRHSVFVTQELVMHQCGQFAKVTIRNKSTLVSKVNCQRHSLCFA